MKKNIIFFLANFEQGGAGKSIANLCSSINQNKYNISIVCLNKCFYKKKFIKKNIKVIEINKKKVIFAQWQISKIIQDHLRTKQKTIFVSNLYYSNALISIFQKKRKNLKFVFIERTPLQELSIYFSIKDFLTKKIITIILKFFYKRADTIVANSKKTSQDIMKFSNCAATYVYPPAYSNNNKKILKKDNRILNILAIGRLSREKNFSYLINTLHRLSHVKFVLRIVGDGPDKEMLEKLVIKLKLQDKIFFLGFKNNINFFLNNSDLLIHTSKFEGFPNVVVEAISAGVPVISSDSHGGIREIMKKREFGLIYSSNIKHSLTKKINYFITHRQHFKIIKKNVHKIFRYYSSKFSTTKYEKIFDSL